MAKNSIRRNDNDSIVKTNRANHGKQTVFAGLWQVYQREILISVSLTIICLIVFGQALNYPFVNFDDNRYIFNNETLLSGLSRTTLRWAFTTFTMGHWHPLTWVSYLIDYQIYGLKSEGFHFTNLLLHITNTVLLFLMLKYLTDNSWCSGAVAAIFAIHPLNVEPVTWVSSRKDLLCALFSFLAILAYSRYVKRSDWRFYPLALLLFALALMGKSMAVTIPAVLLLIDYWPLNRLPATLHDKSALIKTAIRLSLEKLPFFALSLGTIWLELKALSTSELLLSATPNPISPSLTLPGQYVFYGIRLKGFTWYIYKMLFPFDLGVINPYDRFHNIISLTLLLLFLLAVSIFALSRFRRQPYLAVGWGWYLVMLTPVCHLMYSDRYSYLPLIGLFIMIVWGLKDLIEHWQLNQKHLAYAFSVVCALLMMISFIQVQQWRDTLTLLEHAYSLNNDNIIIAMNLGFEMDRLGRVDESVKYYEKAIQLNPKYASAHHNLSAELVKQGKYPEAAEHYQIALKLNANYPLGHFNFGQLLLQQKKTDEAISQFREAIRIKPDYIDAYNYLSNALLSQGKTDEAIFLLNQVLNLDANNSEARFHLANISVNKRNYDEAAAQYQMAIRSNPNFLQARCYLGNVYILQNKINDAITQFQEVLRIKPDSAEARASLTKLQQMKVNK